MVIALIVVASILAYLFIGIIVLAIGTRFEPDAFYLGGSSDTSIDDLDGEAVVCTIFLWPLVLLVMLGYMLVKQLAAPPPGSQKKEPEDHVDRS